MAGYIEDDTIGAPYPKRIFMISTWSVKKMRELINLVLML